MSESPRPTSRPANSFEFVTVAAARARQLLQGCLPKVEGSPKPARRALQEVSSGFVTKLPDEASAEDTE
jgi:DNA-directed RNA polymerase subunit K/omega